MPTRQRARLRSPGQLWGRRTILAGLVLIAVALVGAVIVWLEDDDDGNQRQGQENVDVPLTPAGESFDDPKSGIAVSWPSDWTKLEKGGVLAFRSPDMAVLVGISAPADARDADELRKGAIAETADEYENPVVRPGKGRTIGGLQATGATIGGQRAEGRSVSLIAVAAGKQRAYLLEVVRAENAPTERLAEAQLILNSLQLSK